MEKEIMGIKDVMKELGIGEKLATRILNAPGCPTLPRKKHETFMVPRKAFYKWWEGGNYDA